MVINFEAPSPVVEKEQEERINRIHIIIYYEVFFKSNIFINTQCSRK